MNAQWNPSHASSILALGPDVGGEHLCLQSRGLAPQQKALWPTSHPA